jgi:single-stranded DNA-binding protein
MKHINKVMVVGVIANSLTFIKTSTNLLVCNFSIKTMVEWVDRKTGEVRTNQNIHKACGDDCEYLRNFKKDDTIQIVGRLQHNSWVDSVGNKKKDTVIILEKVEDKPVCFFKRKDATSYWAY